MIIFRHFWARPTKATRWGDWDVQASVPRAGRRRVRGVAATRRRQYHLDLLRNLLQPRVKRRTLSGSSRRSRPWRTAGHVPLSAGNAYFAGYHERRLGDLVWRRRRTGLRGRRLHFLRWWGALTGLWRPCMQHLLRPRVSGRVRLELERDAGWPVGQHLP